MEGDLQLATTGLPLVLLTLLGWAGGVGVILLPIALGADLLARNRFLQLVEAVLAAALAGGAALWINERIQDGHLGGVLGVLTRPIAEGRTTPVSAVLVSLVAFLTVCRVTGRRWHQWAAALVVGSSVVTSFFGGASTALSLALSIVFGWAIGLALRYALGTASTLPAGREIAEALVSLGIPLHRVTLIDRNPQGDRVYRGDSSSGPVDIVVIDRDTFGLGTVRSLVRRLRLRSASTRRPALSVRAETEYRTLMALAFARVGVHAPRILGVAPVGAFSAVLAFRPATGTLLAQRGADTSPEELAALWAMAVRLGQARVTHRELEPAVLLVGDSPGVSSLGSGDIAADDLTRLLDLGQVLVSVAIAVGVERAVDSAVSSLGAERVTRVVPVLQKIALGPATRAALKEHGTLLNDLRERVTALSPDTVTPPPVELRRVTSRALVTVVGGGVAGYLILTQLARVDFATLFAHANWWWVAACVFFAATTFAGPSLSIAGAVEPRLRFVRTYMTQLAVAFSGLVAPAAIGNIALNTRYLVSSGLTPTVAAASIGVVQLAQLCSYAVLLLASGVIAGTGTYAAFTPSPILVAALPVAALLILALLAVPRIRAFVRARILPQVRIVVPQIMRVLRTPSKVARMVVGSLMLDASFVAALVCATRVFGQHTPIAAVAVVYFAGAIIGSAVPTPGGLGGIEAAMSAGLVAVGVDSGVAVSSVLLYRLATYWLPIPFGWLSLQRLQAAKVV